MIDELQLSDIRRFTSAIKSSYNYDFSDYALASFKRRIISILNDNNCNDIGILIEKLTNNKEAFSQFLSKLTVNTTEMFRDPGFWEYFKTEISKTYADKKIKIWHAGCSSGEEVFSMAILLRELGLYDNVKIIATDISSSIIDKAQKGEYLLSKMETNKKNYLKFGGKKTFEEYYKVEGRKARMNSDLLNNVEFKEHNLASEIDKFDRFDIIICRNVMIYFNSNLQDRVYQLFNDNLKIGGKLVIGIRESMVSSSISNKYQLINTKERVFKKIED